MNTSYHPVCYKRVTKRSDVFIGRPFKRRDRRDTTAFREHSALSHFECVEKDRDEGSKRGEQGVQAVNKVLTKTINSYKIKSKR